MKHLPLYPDVPRLAIEPGPGLDARDVDRSCERCALSARTPAGRRCLPPEGDGGGLLVVGEAPTTEETMGPGRAFSSKAGRYVRNLVAEHWKGPVAWDLAVRCAPGREGLKDKHVTTCSAHLRRTIEEIKPSRILSFGGWAAYALTGRSVPVMSARKGYAHTSYGAPAFFLMHPLAALKNRFVRGWLDEDARWALTADPPPAPLGAVYHEVETEADARAAVAALREEAACGATIVWDCETAGWQHTSGFQIVTLALCSTDSDDAWVWPKDVLAAGGPAADVLVDLLTDPTICKGGSNVKYDNISALSRWGRRPRGTVADALFWRKLLWSDASGALEDMADLVGMGGHKEEAKAALAAIRKLLALKRGGDTDDDEVLAARAAVHMGEPWERYAYGLLSQDVRGRYCARDAVTTARVLRWEAAALADRPEARWVWEHRIRRDRDAFEQIEAWGIAADWEAARTLRDGLAARLAPMRDAFEAMGLNPASPVQVAKKLFEELGLPVLKKTPSGAPSTDEEVLSLLAKRAPLAQDLLEFRRLDKLHGTYAVPMAQHIRSDGRIHPNIKVDGTRTGRPSTSEPNVLNFPRPETAEGKMCRDIFVAPPGKLLLNADFSQIELRVAAMLSGDVKMKQIFLDGADYHQRTAEMISQLAWGIPPSQVEKKHRSAAKPVNFGLLYGLADAALAAQIGCTVRQASTLRQAILGNFKQLARWMSEKQQETRRTGESWTWWAGRRARCRSLWQIGDPDGDSYSVAFNSAVNSPIQGTASEFCLESVTQLVEWILANRLDDRVKLVLTVYDSIMLEADEDLMPAVADKAKQVMLSHDSMGVPLGVDFESGHAWGTMEKYESTDAQRLASWARMAELGVSA